MIELTGYQDKHEYVNKHGVKSVVYLMDCMDAMAQMGDNEFSLACVDPPYGIGLAKWDSSIPTLEYFNEIQRVCIHQIIWGANYFHLPHSEAWICWDKTMKSGKMALGKGVKSEFELAWSNTDKKAQMLHLTHDGNIQGFNGGTVNYDYKSIHVCQKPVALYDWIFHNYAKPKDTIFDSHLGSGSSRIAADKHNLPFTGTETDSDYFYAHCKRFDRYAAQMTLF